jgi:hypothetical protein
MSKDGHDSDDNDQDISVCDFLESPSLFKEDNTPMKGKSTSTNNCRYLLHSRFLSISHMLCLTHSISRLEDTWQTKEDDTPIPEMKEDDTPMKEPMHIR